MVSVIYYNLSLVILQVESELISVCVPPGMTGNVKWRSSRYYGWEKLDA